MRYLLLLLLILPLTAEEATNEYGSGSMPLLNFYQKVISPLSVGKSCPMYPSCSQYAKIQFAQERPIRALLFSWDRLCRCGRDIHSYSDTVIDFRPRLIDSPLQLSSTIKPLPEKITVNPGAPDLKSGNFFYQNRFYHRAFASYMDALSKGVSTEALFAAANASYYAHSLHEFSTNVYNLSRLSKEKRVEGELTLLLAKRYYEAKQFKHSLKLLHSFEKLHGENVLRDERLILYELNNLYLHGDVSSKQLTTPLLQEEMNLLHQRLPELNYRNKRLAGLCSVFLPGSGYLVGKRRKTALFSFVITGVTIGSAVELYRNDKPVTASLMALLGTGFYVGSITGARRSVEEYNRNLRYKEMDNILQEIEFGPAR